MSFPEETGDDVIFEIAGPASDDIYGEDFTISSPWFATRDTRRISVVASTPYATDGKVAVEEGIWINGETDPKTVAWHELDAFLTTNGPPGHGGLERHMTSGQVLLTARYFRVHVYGFAAAAAVHFAARRIERNLP